MLENCATDFAKMESQARADETAHQDEFDTFLTQAQMDKAARTKDTEMKEARKGRFEDKKSAKVESLDHTTKELEGTSQYRKDLEHACEDGDSSYADRKDARASEITALREAQGPSIGQNALIRRFEYPATLSRASRKSSPSSRIV